LNLPSSLQNQKPHGRKEVKENARPSLFIYSTTPFVQDGQLGILHSKKEAEKGALLGKEPPENQKLAPSPHALLR
jgi:hypothetical protein